MRTLNETFEDKEFEMLIKEKDKNEETWRIFILRLLEQRNTMRNFIIDRGLYNSYEKYFIANSKKVEKE
jgi:hypothetical protein